MGRSTRPQTPKVCIPGAIRTGRCDAVDTERHVGCTLSRLTHALHTVHESQKKLRTDVRRALGDTERGLLRFSEIQPRHWSHTSHIDGTARSGQRPLREGGSRCAHGGMEEVRTLARCGDRRCERADDDDGMMLAKPSSSLRLKKAPAAPAGLSSRGGGDGEEPRAKKGLPAAAAAAPRAAVRRSGGTAAAQLPLAAAAPRAPAAAAAAISVAESL